uniref:DUF2993 domain-containing protein n=1 Tax=Cyanothece sp. (strain PCC 7425 / ATCC 29141) TaxID=395961 RepID=B8HKE6_CYAP4
MTDSSKPGLGEQALSKVAELGIASQLDEVEEINVEIRADPLKLVQGEVNSVAIAGEGMVMQEDLRMEKLEINTGTVAINPLSAMMGKIELTHPANAQARIVLTEADLNRALSSDFLKEKFPEFSLNVAETPLLVAIEAIAMNLPGDGKLHLEAALKLIDTEEIRRIKLTAIPCIREQGQRISFEEILMVEGEGLSLEMATNLLEEVMVLLDLRNFELEGIDLNLQQLEPQEGELHLQAEAKIEQFPQA